MGGGGTADNDIFSSLVNIILQKYRMKVKKRKVKNRFSEFSYKDGKSFESNENF